MRVRKQVVASDLSPSVVPIYLSVSSSEALTRPANAAAHARWPRSASVCTQYSGYTTYRDIDRDGDDIGKYSSTSIALSACNSNPSCVAFNSQGWVKRSATPAIPYGGLCLYVKTSSMSASSGTCVPLCKTGILHRS